MKEKVLSRLKVLYPKAKYSRPKDNAENNKVIQLLTEVF